MRFLFLLFSLLFSSYAESLAEPVSDTSALGISGYIKSLTQANQSMYPDTFMSGELIHQRTRLRYNFLDNLQLRTDIRTRIFYGKLFEQPGYREGLDDNNELINLDRSFFESQDVLLLVQVDRAYIDYSIEKFNLRVGEQRINWGTNLVWNPNDIFNTYNILDFDYEERNGVQAIRTQYRLSDKSNIDLAGAPGKDTTSVYGLQYKSNYNKYDLQVSLGSVHQQLVTGAGWAGNIASCGFKGEINYYFRKGETQRQFIASTTIDYTTGNQWYLFGSVLYQLERPIGNEIIYSNQQTSSTAKFLMPGNWSFYTGSIKELTPRSSFQMALIYSDYLNTLIAFPSFSFNPGNELELLTTFQAIFNDQRNKWQYEGIAGFLRIKYSF